MKRIILTTVSAFLIFGMSGCSKTGGNDISDDELYKILQEDLGVNFTYSDSIDQDGIIKVSFDKTDEYEISATIFVNSIKDSIKSNFTILKNKNVYEGYRITRENGESVDGALAFDQCYTDLEYNKLTTNGSLCFGNDINNIKKFKKELDLYFTKHGFSEEELLTFLENFSKKNLSSIKSSTPENENSSKPKEDESTSTENKENNVNPVVKKLQDLGYRSITSKTFTRETMSDDGVNIKYEISITDDTFSVIGPGATVRYDYYTRQGFGGVCVLDFDTGAYDSLSSALTKAECKGVAQSITYLKPVFEKELNAAGITLNDLNSIK